MASPEQPQRPYQTPEDPFGGFFKGIGEFFDALSAALSPDETPFNQAVSPRAVAPIQPAQHGLAADIFDEENHLLVVIELPGLSADHIQVAVDGDILTVEVTDDTAQNLELLLPCAVLVTTLTWRYHNGILEARVAKAQEPRT